MPATIAKSAAPTTPGQIRLSPEQRRLNPDQARLAADNFAFARREARRWCRRTGLPRSMWDDMDSAAMLGVVDAVRRYDASTGVPFWGFARSRIRGAMLDCMRANDWMNRKERELGFTESRACQIRTVALARLRRELAAVERAAA